MGLCFFMAASVIDGHHPATGQDMQPEEYLGAELVRDVQYVGGMGVRHGEILSEVKAGRHNL
jgi:hypothetical protein